MGTTPSGLGTMTDPKQPFDDEIEEAFVEEQVIMNAPKPQNPLGALAIDGKCLRPLAIALGTGLAISSIAVSIAAAVARVRAHRTPRFKDIVLRARRPRRFGYSRVRFGRFGQAFLTYTYKIPAIRIHVPRFTYKVPRCV